MHVDPKDLAITIDRYQLSNGLEVFLVPDHGLPIVAVNLWYHVGSKDENPGLTGLAHLFEHLMFEGSVNHDDEYFKPLQEAGGSVNGSTSHDRTNYYEVVPSNFLELALWLEADRMGGLLPVLSAAKLENQRSVVMNERRQRVDNQPYGKIGEEIAQNLYPQHHPYSWPVIGWMEHIEAATLDDVHSFFRTYYHPANATLAVVGNFETAKARRWIDQYFGPIAAGPPANGFVKPSRLSLATERRLRWEEPVGLPRLDLLWLTGPRFDADEPALDFAAQILSGRSKDSRLQRRLLHDEKLVQSIAAFHHSQKLGGTFGVRAYALPGTSTETIEAVIREEIQALATTLPSDEEMERVRNDFRNMAYSRIEAVLGKADFINHHRYYLGYVDDHCFATELIRYEKVTAADVVDAAHRYLRQHALVAEVLTGGATSSSTHGHGKPATDSGPKHQRQAVGILPRAEPNLEFTPVEAEQAVLSNGLRLVVLTKRDLPRIDFQLLVRGGSGRDRAGKLGLARLVGDVLDEGTRSRDGLEIAQALDRLGASLSVGTGVESAAISMRTLRINVDEAFPILAEIIREPRFAAEDLDRERERLLAEIAYRHKQPAYLADEAIDLAIFGGDHPYGRASDGTIEGIHAVTARDLAEFHQMAYIPQDATLIAVGNVTMAEVRDLVEAHLRDWTAPGAAPAPETEPLVNVQTPALHFIPRTNAPQSVIRIGRRCIPRRSPDYFPLLVMNTILGGQFASRLNLNLREEKGYTYGARSSFMLRRVGGSFIAGTDVDSDVTREAVVEILREIEGLCDSRPVTHEELTFAKAYLTRRFPARFETTSSIASQLAHLSIYGLPDDYYQRYSASVNAVTAADVADVAQKYLTREGIKLVVVGAPEQEARLTGLVENMQ